MESQNRLVSPRTKSLVLENQHVDLKQEQSIAELRQENQELKLYLATLIRLLVSKGALTQAEVDATVRAIETRK